MLPKIAKIKKIGTDFLICNDIYLPTQILEVRPILLHFAVAITLCTFLRTNSVAQAINYDDVDGYSIAHYDDESGLPQNSVKGICRGNNGQIWIMTETGLVEYDGTKFITYNYAEFDSLSARGYKICYFSSFKTKFAISENNKLISLSGDLPLGISLKQPLWDTVQHSYIPKQILDSISHRHVLYGQLMVANFVHSNYDIFILVQTSQSDHFYLISPRDVYYVNYEGVLWHRKIKQCDYHYATVGNTLLIWDEGKNLTTISTTGKLQHIPFPDIWTLIWNAAENQLFIITKEGSLFYINEHLGIEHILSNLPGEFKPYTAYYDKKQKTLFLGSTKDGLLVCRKKKFITHAPVQKNKSIFYSLLPFQDTAVISPSGCIIGKGGSVRVFNDSIFNSGGPLYTISLDKKGNYSFWGLGGILKMSSDTKFISKRSSHIPPSIIYNDEENVNWIEYSSYKFEKETGNTLSLVNYPKTRIKCILPLNSTYMLVGGDDGIYTFNKKTFQYKYLRHSQGIQVRSMFRSSTGKVYATTLNSGILSVKADGIKKLPLDKNEYLKFSHCIREDAHNRFWISSNKGLFCIPESDLNIQQPNRNGHIFYYYFGRENGFNTNEFNGGCFPCAATLPTGEFAFPSLDGVVWFHPDSIPIEFPQNKLKLKKTILDDTLKVQTKDTILIPREFRRLEMFLSIPFYKSIQNIVVEYNTENNKESKSWAETDLRSPLIFTSLKSGYNHIYFRVRNGFGENAYTYLTVTYYRAPQLWERDLFYPAIILLIIITAYILYRIRTKTLEKRNENLQNAVEEGKKTIVESYHLLEKNERQLKSKTRFQDWLITSLVHDLRGPLRFIMQYSGLHARNEKPSVAELDFLYSVVDTSKNIYSYSEQLLQMLKLQQGAELLPEKLNFEKKLDDRLETFAKELEWKKISVEKIIRGSNVIHINQVAISIILQNLLDNAIKLQSGGILKIVFGKTEKHATLEICDQGPGMDIKLIEKLNKKNIHETEEYPEESGLGMWLILSLVKKTGGEICFTNNDIGLCVTIIWKQEI